MTMARFQEIAQTKSHHQVYQQDTEITVLTQDDVIGPHLRIAIAIGTITMTIKTGIGLAGVTVAVTHKEVALGPITDPNAIAYHITEAQAHTAINETPTQQILIMQKFFQRLQ